MVVRRRRVVVFGLPAVVGADLAGDDHPRGCDGFGDRPPGVAVPVGEVAPLFAAWHPVTEVAARLGHAHPGITLQTYAQAIPGNERAAADAIDGLLADALQPVANDSRGTRVVGDGSGVVVPITR